MLVAKRSLPAVTGAASSELQQFLRRYHARQQVIRKKRCLEATRCDQGRGRRACVGVLPVFHTNFQRGRGHCRASRSIGHGRGKNPLELLQCELREPLRLARACARRRHHPGGNRQYRRRPIRPATAPRLSARTFHAPARVCQGAYPLPPAPDRQTRGRQVRAHQLG